MKRKLLAMLLCTVILFNNALPVLAEMDPAEGNTTETTTTAPEVTEPITPVVDKCKVCDAENCEAEHVYCETCAKYDCEVDHSAPECDCPDGIHVEGCDEYVAPADKCEVCGAEGCEAEHVYCETCAKYDCEVDHSAPECTCGEAHDEANADCPQYVAPVEKATCPKCGVEYTVVEGEEHACETTTCADCNETYITAVGHECPVVKCSTCNAVIEGEDHVCEEHICEVCQATYYGETHECEMCECGKLLGHEDACQICLCGAIDENTHAEDCMNIMMPKCEICEGAHTTEKCPENCQACLEVEGAEHTCGKIFCEICMEEMFEDIEHIHCEECEELLIEGECPICDARVALDIVNFTDVAPFLDPVEGPVAVTWRLRSSYMLATASDDIFARDGEGDSRADADGLETSKTVVNNGDGTYTITLENYVTGNTTVTNGSKDVPTDIVLVLDQSGSMAYCIKCGKSMNSNSTHGTGEYTYTEYTYSWRDYDDDNVYVYVSNGEYERAYYCDGGFHSDGWYTQDHGWSHNGDRVTSQIYVRTEETESCSSRIDALTDAVNNFVTEVATKAKGADGEYDSEGEEKPDDINHRIAIVGFASQSGYGNNTEILTVTGDNSSYTGGTLGVAYNDLSVENYQNAFQDMTVLADRTMVTNAISA
ncbi:MAG: hypothetical protein IJE55_05800, partial [Clostridia bacterium]|nr:hypothetical protein [Clostridia bacterium]